MDDHTEGKTELENPVPALSDEEVERLYHEMIGQAGEAWEEEDRNHYHPAG